MEQSAKLLLKPQYIAKKKQAKNANNKKKIKKVHAKPK